MGLDRVGTGAMLAILALCTLLMSTISFLHIRHASESRDRPQERILPGFTLSAAGPSLIVTSVESGGEAARHGMVVGDEVLAIDQNRFHSLEQAEAYLVKSPHSQMRIELREAGQTRLVTLDSAGE